MITIKSNNFIKLSQTNMEQAQSEFDAVIQETLDEFRSVKGNPKIKLSEAQYCQPGGVKLDAWLCLKNKIKTPQELGLITNFLREFLQATKNLRQQGMANPFSKIKNPNPLINIENYNNPEFHALMQRIGLSEKVDRELQ